MRIGFLKALGRSALVFAVAAITVTGPAPTVCAEPAPDWTRAFADRIYDAWKNGDPMPQISLAHPEAALADAYQAQRHFVRRILESDTIGGFKAAGVGTVSKDHPLTAVMPASGARLATENVVIDLSKDPSRHVETEIGYRFGGAVARPLENVEALRGKVDAIMAVIEVPGGVVEETAPATTADIVAWNINAKEMILGRPFPPDQVDPDKVEILLLREGEPVNTAKGDMAAAGQWPTLLKAVNSLVRQGYVIEPGHVITNGALGKIIRAEPGYHQADFGILGKIAFEVR